MMVWKVGRDDSHMSSVLLPLSFSCVDTFVCLFLCVSSDIAISAPYEGLGVVYLYYGSDTDTCLNTTAQLVRNVVILVKGESSNLRVPMIKGARGRSFLWEGFACNYALISFLFPISSLSFSRLSPLSLPLFVSLILLLYPI